VCELLKERESEGEIDRERERKRESREQSWPLCEGDFTLRP
jgi:hypothetical protein